MASPVVVTFGGITFNDGAADLNGARWYCGEIDGWDAPAMRQSALEPTGRHGVVIGGSFYGPRALVLGGPKGSAGAGSCVVPSKAAWWASYYRLMAAAQTVPLLGSRPAPIPLVVAEPTPKRALVLRADRVRVRGFGGTAGFEFEVPLLAPDPRKYAETATTTAIAGTVTNAGNIDTWPVLTVVGSAAGNILVTNAGKTVRLDIALTGGQTLVADFGAGTVTVNGVNRGDVVNLGVTRWWPLAPGANTVTYSGGGTPSLTFRSAWA